MTGVSRRAPKEGSPPVRRAQGCGRSYGGAFFVCPPAGRGNTRKYLRGLDTPTIRNRAYTLPHTQEGALLSRGQHEKKDCP